MHNLFLFVLFNLDRMFWESRTPSALSCALACRTTGPKEPTVHVRLTLATDLTVFLMHIMHGSTP